MDHEKTLRQLHSEVLEVSQDFLLLAYETDSARISRSGGNLIFSGFSGKLVMNGKGDLSLTVGENIIPLTGEGIGNDMSMDEVCALIDRLKRLGEEIRKNVAQSIISGK